MELCFGKQLISRVTKMLPENFKRNAIIPPINMALPTSEEYFTPHIGNVTSQPMTEQGMKNCAKRVALVCYSGHNAKLWAVRNFVETMVLPRSVKAYTLDELEKYIYKKLKRTSRGKFRN